MGILGKDIGEVAKRWSLGKKDPPKDQQPPVTVEEVGKVRSQIDELLDKKSYEAIGRLPGIKVVRAADSFTQPVNCLVYVFGFNQYGQYEHILDEASAEHNANQILERCTEVPTAQAGDYVTYTNKFGIMSHAGIAVDTQRVVSKFGFDTDVLEHPMRVVPTNYGDTIKIFRRNEPLNQHHRTDSDTQTTAVRFPGAQDATGRLQKMVTRLKDAPIATQIGDNIIYVVSSTYWPNLEKVIKSFKVHYQYKQALSVEPRTLIDPKNWRTAER